ncbi:GH25 family lysozyme [Streptomyces sp. TS71-3]|uniref:GH25 family lysozyme n=1 Tax=Streptomyces sp. TS71-3 TaxID=2733862 RepID=UPI001B036BF1|nr:GH25 family lysozyme [Streptomyces sp. TS71-3]GHJ36161.1 hydrolase [Streptomyces sp. TS71-3]
MLHGIDVSSYQTSFDTDGLAFVFVKATEGRSYINPKQSEQAKRARDAGCVVGFYHFLWPGNIKAQAEYFVEKCASVEEDLLAADWEYTGEGTAASNAEKDSFIREVKRLRPQHRVMLYCNRDFWLNHDTTSYAGDGLWIADHVDAGKPRIKADWTIHQYSSTPLDKNVADFKSAAAMRDWATALQ